MKITSLGSLVLVVAVSLVSLAVWDGAQKAGAESLAQQIICLEFDVNNHVIGSLATLGSGFCPPGTSTSTLPTLTVVKVVHGGDKAVSDFPLFVDGSPVTSGVATTVSIGAHAVTETGDAHYSLAYSGACDNTGTVVLGADESKTCVLTNTFTSAPPNADISVTKSVSNTAPAVGDSVVYTITVSNSGPDTASGVVVTDTLPAGVSYVSDDASGAYSSTTGQWVVGSLASSAQATLHITVSINPGTQGQPIHNAASATSTTADVALGNNTSATVDITPRSLGTLGALVVQKVVSGGSAAAGDFSIHVFLGDTEIAGSPKPASASTVFSGLAAGNYVVDESGGPDGYTAAFAGDCGANGSIAVAAGATSTCTVTNTFSSNTGGGGGNGGASASQTPAPQGGGGGSILSAGPLWFGSQGQGSTTGAGEVLGTTTCGTYLTSYLRIGRQNDPEQVRRLQVFLNVHMQAGLPVTGFFGQLTDRAVRAFQVRYGDDVLAPWVPHGLASSRTSTGYVYKTTLHKINLIMCETLDIPPPVLP